MRNVDSSVEVAELQKGMKETNFDPDDKEREVVRKGEEVVEPDQEETKRGYEKYLSGRGGTRSRSVFGSGG